MAFKPTTKPALALRPHLSWRGIVLPYSSASCEFEQVQATNPILNRTELVQVTVRKARIFTYEIPLTDGLSIDPYKQAFTKTFNEFLAAYIDKSRGVLIDPVHGTLDAVPGKWVNSLSLRDFMGTEAKVTFAESIDPDTIEQDPPVVTWDAVLTNAKALDTAILSIPKLRLPPKFPPAITFAQTILKIKGYGGTLIRAGKRATAELHAVANACEKLVETFDKLTNPVDTLKARQAAQRLHKSVQAVLRRADPIHSTRVFVVRGGKSVAALTAQVGMEVADLVQLNPPIATSPVVPPGARVRVTNG